MGEGDDSSVATSPPPPLTSSLTPNTTNATKARLFCASEGRYLLKVVLCLRRPIFAKDMWSEVMDAFHIHQACNGPLYRVSK